MNEKFVGYLLLFFGVGIILFSGFDAWQVFTGAKQPVNLFRFPGISIDFSSLMNQQSLPENLQVEGININQILKKSTPTESKPKNQEIISKDMVNLPMNLFAHLFFLGFFATVGLKIATVGTYLVRTIEVKVKEQSHPQSKQ